MRIRFNQVPGASVDEHFLLKKLELAQIKKQIEVLSTFIPDEILKLNQDELLHIHNYVGVLLFADVSGFTPLTEKYNKTGKGGIYRLTATLNAYIGAIVEVLYFYGGDVLKFSGDAFLALWKVKPDDSLLEILHEVVVCALVIQQTLGRFETEVNVLLKVKLAISCGNMTFSVIGDDVTRHYVIVGDAINDVKAAEHASVSGDVVISPGAWTHMLQERYQITLGDGGNIKVWKVYYKPNEEDKKSYYEQKQVDVQKLITSHINRRNLLHKLKNFDSNLTDTKITQDFMRSLPPRIAIKEAPRNWVFDDLKPFIIKPVQNQVDESQPVEYLTEMREVTIQFINIVPVTYYEPTLVEMVDNAFKIICKIVGDVLGVVNKVSLFDKDVMILVLFGLRGVKHEMESQNALKSGYKIRDSVAQLKNVQTISVGITNGFVYCGVVGHPMRREYTVIGGAVNKAARMMCSFTEKVTCDHKTFKHSKLSSFYFQLQKTIKLKGIEESGTIFEYNEKFDSPSSSQRVNIPIIGRDLECQYIETVIMKPKLVDNYRGVCIQGAYKAGKSKILKSILAKFKYEMNNKYTVASIALTGVTRAPYHCIGGLYRQLYDEKAKIHSEDYSKIKNLPHDLYDQKMLETLNFDDIATCKYKILNYFRNMVTYTYKLSTILFIDDIEYIDNQSWEILEIVIKELNVRMITTANFDDRSSDLRFKISINNHIKVIELNPLHNCYIPIIACQFLNAAGIPNSLVTLLAMSCDGKPGYIQKSLLRMVNNGSIELRLIHKEMADTTNWKFPPPTLLGFKEDDIIIPIIELSEKYKSKTEELTLAAISLDLFDSFTAYQQLVLKTASVLGEIFTRDLLIVTLQYPSEKTLAVVMKQLFEEEVFDCGSRFIYSMDIEGNKICCRCFFDEDYFNDPDRQMFPRYSYCKIIHFKNKSIRDVAYELLPGNQRKELHLHCAEVLEEIKSHCPYCLRQPSQNYICFTKFKEIIRHCTNPKLHFGGGLKLEEFKEDDFMMKDVIRNTIRADTTSVYNSSAGSDETYSAQRIFRDPAKCSCLEIMHRLYLDLLYHSERAGHLGKQIFFTMQFGVVCAKMVDYTTAMLYLTEARELCMKDARLPNSQISETFRRIHVGRCETMLAHCCIRLRQLISARCHLSLALRQYHIPSTAYVYKPFNIFMTRSCLVSMKRIKPYLMHNYFIRGDLARCLVLCAVLFTYEGNYGLAKLASNYALFLLKTINPEVPLLCNAYSNAIDIYRHFHDMHMCARLLRNVVKHLQICFANNRTLDLQTLCIILSTIFEIRCISGNIVPAIRLGYRILEISFKCSYLYTHLSVLNWLILMLIFNFRLKDCVDICRTTENTYMITTKLKYALVYYNSCLGYYLMSGFLIEPINVILKFAKLYFSGKKRPFTWDELLFISRVHLHYLRLSKYIIAADWKQQIVFNATNCKNFIVFNILIVSLEGLIMEFVQNRRTNKPNIEVDERVIIQLLSILNGETKKHYKCFRPFALYMQAWFHKIQGRPKKSKKLLKEGIQISQTQNNILGSCLGKQLNNHWSGGFAFKYNVRPISSGIIADSFTMDEWAQYLHAYPIE